MKRLLNLILSLIVVAVTIWQVNPTQAAPLAQAITFSPVAGNVTDRTATITWATDTAVTGEVRYGPTTPNQTAYDERGPATSSETHSVTLTGLNPETTYTFDVVSGGVTDDNGGTHYSFTTGSSLMVPPVDTIYGQVFQSDGTTPATGAIVRFRIVDADGSGAPGQSGWLSVLVEPTGYWAGNLGGARIESGLTAFMYSANDQLEVEVIGGSMGRTTQTFPLTSYTPTPDIVLSETIPNIKVNPTSMDVTLETGQTTQQTLNIQNTGTAPLTYTLSANAASWLQIGQNNGTVPANNSVTIPITFDSNGLDTGPYNNILTIAHNAPVTNPLEISVSLSVLPDSELGLLAEYYNYPSSLGKPPPDPFTNDSLAAQQVDPQINFQWNYGPPIPGVGGDLFAVRWIGYVHAPLSGAYRFNVYGDNGLRAWINGELLIDCWQWCGSGSSVNLNLEAGQWYPLKIEYWEDRGAAHARFRWIKPGQSSYEVVPNEYLTTLPPLLPPTINFTAKPLSGTVPLTVAFTGYITNTINALTVNYGDGPALTVADFGSGTFTMTHVYTQPGTYTVSMTVNGPGGNNTKTRQNYIVVEERPVQTLTIPIYPEWQPILLPLIPENTPIEQALGSIDGYYDLVYAYDAGPGEWSRYAPDGPGFGNTLSTVGPTDGLWLRGTLTGTLTLTGAYPTSITLPLELDWNLVGFPLNSPRPIADVLAPVAGKFDLVYTYDLTIPNKNERWLRYAPDGPGFGNTLTEIEPGKGYWIRMTAAGTLPIQN